MLDFLLENADDVIWWAGGFIGGSVLFAMAQSSANAPGRALAKRFAKLGTLTGKSRGEITRVVGNPGAISAVAEDRQLLQWQAAGYHVALLFEGDLCVGVTHEHLVHG